MLTENKNAFTLVELAIVIVIIGLLVGGVLQGQELIKQAQIRAQIKQLEEYDAATLTFRAKYNFLPGDFPATRRSIFNFHATAGTDYSGNGRIDDSSGNIPNLLAYNESYVFFSDLWATRMIKDYIWHTSGYSVDGTFPKSKMGDGGIAAVGLVDGMYWFLGPTMKNDAANTYQYYLNSVTPSFSSSDGFGIDGKLDDGNPATGIVRAVIVTNSVTTNFSNDTTTGTGNTTCIGGTANTYNFNATSLLCRLIVKSKAN